MGILSTELIDDQSSIDKEWKRSYTRTYQVRATIDFDSYSVRTNLGIGIYQPHPNDPGAISDKITVSLATPTKCAFFNESNPSDPNNGLPSYVWAAAVEYGPWNPLLSTSTGDPTAQPLRPRFSSTTRPQIIYEDVEGNPIVNSAGDYYDPPIEIELPVWTLSVTRNEISPSMGTLVTYVNRTNESEWLGFAPKTVKILPIDLPEPQYDQINNTLYYPIEYKFEINPYTWTKQVINQGRRQLAPDGSLVDILIHGVPASEPVMLDANGHAILTPDYLDTNRGVAPDNPSGSNAVGGTGSGTGSGTSVIVNAYEVYQPLDFTELDSGFSGTQVLANLTF